MFSLNNAMLVDSLHNFIEIVWNVAIWHLFLRIIWRRICLTVRRIGIQGGSPSLHHGLISYRALGGMRK